MTTTATISLASLRAAAPRHDSNRAGRWRIADVEALFAMPFMDLLFHAQQMHREHFNANEVQLSTLVSIKAGVSVEVGMGETRAHRAELITQLANLEPYPESVPINHLVQGEGTPLVGPDALDLFEFVRTIAVARITMPRAMVRLSAGSGQMNEALQALCFAAGTNSIFYGDELLTTANPQAKRDRALLDRLGLRARG